MVRFQVGFQAVDLNWAVKFWVVSEFLEDPEQVHFATFRVRKILVVVRRS
jgi:hypothetical protein